MLFLFIFFVVLTTLCVVTITYVLSTQPIKETLRDGDFWMCLFWIILFVILSIAHIESYKQKIQSDAIDHYIVGDVELVEKVVDGETVDWTYIVKDADYD